MIKAQDNDPDIKSIKASIISKGSNGIYVLERNILFKKKSKLKLLVIPKNLISTVCTLCHDDMSGGHFGFKKVWPKIKNRYFWKSMYYDVKAWVKSCKSCAKRKTPKIITKIGMNPIGVAKLPFEMIGVDILGPLPETTSGYKYILVFTDYLTRWPEAFPIKRIDAKTIAKVFVDEIVCRHSAPAILLSDQGAQFMSGLVKNICEYLMTKKINTTAYHPQTNGLTERFNATLCQTLAIYGKENQTDWDTYIPTALFAYRSSVQETTGQSPFELLYGRDARLPSNLESVKTISDDTTREFKKKWEKAYSRIEAINKKRKFKFDSKYKEKIINIGDSVRLHNAATKVGLKNKLRGEIWTGPFKVMGKAPNGNLKLNTFKRKYYIVHPDRVKLAESERENFPIEIKLIQPPKKVRFKPNFSLKSDV